MLDGKAGGGGTRQAVSYMSSAHKPPARVETVEGSALAQDHDHDSFRSPGDRPLDHVPAFSKRAGQQTEKP